jgi:glycosyltransferase involved in cell wall biosynthesis
MRTYAPATTTEPIPRIAPRPEEGGRPFFSVMMPTYECGDLFEQALRGVLDQDPGPDRMQIAVIDDHSSGDVHARVVRRLAPGRVEVHRHPANVGLARNWNACIERSRGLWVHVLHQDDVVLPGFYDRLARAADDPARPGAAFCRHDFIDDSGRPVNRSAIERETAGVLEGWLGSISRRQLIQCPSIVVRRDVYERLGGFRTDLCYALDWEMWVRIAAHYPVWFEPEPLACYRMHGGNETSRLRAGGRDIADVRRAITILAGVVPPEYVAGLGRHVLADFRDQEILAMIRQLSERRVGRGLAHFVRANRWDPSLKFSRRFYGSLKWGLETFVRHSLGRDRSPGPGGRPGPGFGPISSASPSTACGRGER